MVNLSALYLSLKRLSEIVDVPTFGADDDISAIRDIASHGLVRTRLVHDLETRALKWLEEASPPTLGSLLATSGMTPGTLFTHYGAFYGKGIIDAAVRFDEGKPVKKTPYIWTKLDSFIPDATLKVQAHPENLTSISAPDEMAGKKRLFLLARAVDIEPPEITAQAYVVGHIYEEERSGGFSFAVPGSIQSHMEVHPSQIETFGLLDVSMKPTAAQLKGLRSVPESDVKAAFAEIIGEPFVPKDWGGEKSDLFSTNVVFDGKPTATAFAFKGPAVFKPLTVAHLGKNGDQISRLYSEPADLVVLQHCNQITTAVRDHMRAFSMRIGNLRPFALIDGADTVRIFEAYKKCGY